MKRVAQFVRHAERFGVEGVYETAEVHLGPEERGSLAMHLRRIDPDWKLSADERHRLVFDMASAGAADAKIGKALGVGRQAANAAKAELTAAEPSTDVFKPEKCRVFAGCTYVPVYAQNTTPHASDGWQSWVYGGANVRHVGGRKR